MVQAQAGAEAGAEAQSEGMQPANGRIEVREAVQVSHRGDNSAPHTVRFCTMHATQGFPGLPA